MPAYLNYKNIILGNMPGCIGEISAIALLIGAAYLLILQGHHLAHPHRVHRHRRRADLHLRPRGYSRADWVVYNVFSGSMLLGAFFMANDYATSPVTMPGQLLYGFGCGVLTVLIRYFGSYPEGVSYGILIMNLCTWAIDKAFCRPQFGVTRKTLPPLRPQRKRQRRAHNE